MSLFNDKINKILEKTDLDANELRPGDLCLNTNKECDHYGSKGKVLKVFKLKEPNNTIGKFIRYKVLNDGPTYKKGDVLDKTEIQLKKVNENAEWNDGDIKITLEDILKYSSKPIKVNPNKFKKLLINVSRDPVRIENANLKFPIVVSLKEGKPFKILDGQHRVVKAIKTNQPILAKFLDLNKVPEHMQNMFKENYADGKVKGKSRPGRVKKSGASCKGSVTSLRAKAKKAGGEKGKMYHWCANMKGGKKK